MALTLQTSTAYNHNDGTPIGERGQLLQALSARSRPHALMITPRPTYCVTDGLIRAECRMKSQPMLFTTLQPLCCLVCHCVLLRQRSVAADWHHPDRQLHGALGAAGWLDAWGAKEAPCKVWCLGTCPQAWALCHYRLWSH